MSGITGGTQTQGGNFLHVAELLADHERLKAEYARLEAARVAAQKTIDDAQIVGDVVAAKQQLALTESNLAAELASAREKKESCECESAQILERAKAEASAVSEKIISEAASIKQSADALMQSNPSSSRHSRLRKTPRPHSKLTTKNASNLNPQRLT